MSVSNDLDLACAWQQALNVAPGSKGPFGYLLEWSGLGGLVLSKDIVVWNPLGGAAGALLGGDTVACVGVVERFRFGGGPTDPLRISCLVSQENQTNLRAKLARDLVDTRVRMCWSMVAYDQAAKAWFSAIDLLEPKRLDGLVSTVDGALQISIAAGPSPLEGQQDLQVYRFEVEVVPAPRKRTTLQLALGQNQRIVAEWGGEQ